MRSRPKTALTVGFCVLLISSGVMFLLSTSEPALASSQPAQIQLSGNPWGAALDYANHDIYVANALGYVLVVDPASGTVVKNITTGGDSPT